MSGRIVIGLVVILLVAGMVFMWVDSQHHLPPPAAISKPSPATIQSSTENHPAEPTASTQKPTDDSVPSSPSAPADFPDPSANNPSDWKKFVSSEYKFELSYPADWLATVDYENNYGKPPSGKGRPAYAGETRILMNLEKDGPTQSDEGGGDFSDGAIITIRITGTTAVLEDWTISPGKPWSIHTSTPAAWIAQESSFLGGDKINKIPITTNGFEGTIELACTGANPCTPFGEGGGAYRVLPSGRALVVDWERMNGQNDFGYDKYLLPILDSFKLLQ